MSVLLEVREFDCIISNPDYRDDARYKYLKKEEFDKLVGFIEEYTATDDNADALSFMQVSFRHPVGQVVTIKNYVGLIQFDDGSQIQILPKISFDTEEDLNTRTKKTFIKMLRSLKDFPSKVFTDSFLKVESMTLYELFINMYLQEVRQLVKKGIKSNYVTHEDNLRFFKGKFMLNEHIKKNLAHHERFYLSYDEFNPDTSENKIIKATLQKLQRITTSIENSKEIRQLLVSFEMVEPSKNYEKDFAKVTINRSNIEYDNIMRWSKVFLLNKSFSTFSGKTTSRALLFPMETVFESYVAKEVRKVMAPSNWEVTLQDKGYYLFSEPKHKFALRPDIVLRKGDRTVILDTKWKELCNNERDNYGISQSDMYQMYAYSKKYETPEIWLLYPINEEMRGNTTISFKSDDGTVVSVYFVDVAEIESSLTKLRNVIDSE